MYYSLVQQLKLVFIDSPLHNQTAHKEYSYSHIITQKSKTNSREESCWFLRDQWFRKERKCDDQRKRVTSIDVIYGVMFSLYLGVRKRLSLLQLKNYKLYFEAMDGVM
ncbi:Hypothetical_protein [Hexamita inflata]|uniref:Hypothetical_protein n=1 Tax=Hexamita inflata TaxID=28002 RepID=A0AA86U1V4_9EUKA|nr:Hypothetical protein HINF_LOCUS26490 [Hexamita inflata]